MVSPERFVHYKIGIKEIDDDHYSLFSKSDVAIQFLKDRNYKEAQFLLNEIYSDLENHFMKEESFMRAIGFGYIDAHIESHEEILCEIKEITAIENIIKFQINCFIKKLEDIIIGHIDQFDMQYAEDAKARPEMIINYTK